MIPWLMIHWWTWLPPLWAVAMWDSWRNRAYASVACLSVLAFMSAVCLWKLAIVLAFWR